MTEQINFELVSPEKKLISEPLYHAVIPGLEGEMGVGAKHASFVVSLKPGVVRLYKEKGDKDPQRIFIAGGFADITGTQCVVLAEQAVNVNDIDQKALETQIKTLTDDLGLAVEDADKARLSKALDLAEAKLAAIETS